MKRTAALIAVCAVLFCGCRAAPDRTAAADGGAAGVVQCRGYVVIATQMPCRQIELQEVAIASLMDDRRAERLEALEGGSADVMSRMLSGFDRPAEESAPVEEPLLNRPKRRKKPGDTTTLFGDSLFQEREEDDPLGNWGWLNADVSRAERAAAQVRQESSRSDWIESAGWGMGEDTRLRSGVLPGLEADE